MARIITIVLFLFLISVPAMAQEARVHTVEAGETLYRIAQQYGVTVDDLRAWNDLAGDHLSVGQSLVVGYASAEEESAETQPLVLEEGELVAPGEYRAGTGDTFFSIAERLDVTADTLASMNPDLLTHSLEPGDVVRVPEVVQTEVTHIVQEGENLSSIARQYSVTVAQIRQVNNLQSDIIRVGQALTIRPEAVQGDSEPQPIIAEGPVVAYPGAFSGRATASGEPYDPEKFTASHPELPFGTVVLITNPATGRKCFARINDRGPVDRNLVMEVSAAVARELELEEFDERPVTVQLVH